jgi:hypothetical protein
VTTIPGTTSGAAVGAVPAVPTTYGGVRFRSRLEARWACLLDRMGVRWLYEPRTFKFAEGWYLPDFYVQGPPIGGGKGTWWLEIKSASAQLSFGSELYLPGDRVHAQTGEPFAAVFGFPGYRWRRDAEDSWTWTSWPDPAPVPPPWTNRGDTYCEQYIFIDDGTDPGFNDGPADPCGSCVECVARGVSRTVRQ